MSVSFRRLILSTTTSLSLCLAASAAIAAPETTEPAMQPPSAPTYDTNQQVPAGMTRGQLDGYIKEYLLTHPEVLVQALVLNEQQQKQQDSKAVEMGIKTHQAELYNDAGSPVVGNPHGDVTIVTFFDYNCTFCKKLSPTISELVKEDPNLRVIFKEYPILSPESEVAAKASLAFNVISPAKYLEFHVENMKHAGSPDLSAIIAVANKLGVNGTKLKNTMESTEVASQLENVRNLASALYVEGTPATVIGEELLVGSVDLDTLKQKIAKLRESQKKPL